MTSTDRKSNQTLERQRETHHGNFDKYDAIASRRDKSALIAGLAPWLLTIPSALIGIVLVELFCWLFVPSIGWNMPGRDRRVIFFDGASPIFENRGEIFTYSPSKEIRNVVGFFSDVNFKVEYDYRFRTNNYGLVQTEDINPGRTSLLLLGDSFTEGQGAEPWFRLVSPAIARLGYQPINGGLLGTGFQQWLELDRYLAAKNIQIGKLLVVFISDDYHRPVWKIPREVSECLSASPLCRADKSYFYHLPPPEEMPSWIAEVRTARGPLRPRLKLSAEALLPASYSIYRYFTQLITFARAEHGSHDAIAELVRIYGPQNVAFLHLPEKTEVGLGPDALGLKARRAIADAGGKLFDGFKLCQLGPADYYANDDHPNKDGYAKIATCVSQAINDLATEGQ